MSDKTSMNRKLWFEILGGKMGEDEGVNCMVEFNSHDPSTGQSVGFLDTLVCWQTLTQVLISSLEGMDDPEDLVGKLQTAYKTVFPNDKSEFLSDMPKFDPKDAN